MKKTLVVLLVLGLVVAGFSTMGMAFRGTGARGGNRGQYYRQENRLHDYQYQVLDLSEEQQEELNEFRQEFFNNREEVREQLIEKQNELRELLLKKGNEEITAIKEEILQLQQELLQKKIEQYQHMKEILSEEKLAKLQEITQARNTLRKYGLRGEQRGHRFYGRRGPGF